jgi:hypothetical protein
MEELTQKRVAAPGVVLHFTKEFKDFIFCRVHLEKNWDCSLT